ncbi:hypothetical protein [Streptomyces albireticuli]|uniref:hypothetical protein n=1 Tax=Streptomyces albireticuli TaxID=1940 RepID=UPI003683483C
MRTRSVGALAAFLVLALAVLLTFRTADAGEIPVAPSLTYSAGAPASAENDCAHPGEGSGGEQGMWRAHASHRGGTAQPRQQVQTTAPLGNSHGGTGVDPCAGQSDRHAPVTARGSGRQVGTLIQVFRH